MANGPKNKYAPLEVTGPRKSQPNLWLRSWASVAVVLLLVVFLGVLHSPGSSSDGLGVVPEGGIPEGSTLRQVIALHRHGDRTAIRKYSFELAQWEWALGKLTPAGLLDGFHFGRRLAVLFPTLLNTILARHAADASYRALLVRSTDVDRTVDTAHAVLIGLLSAPDVKPEFTTASDAVCHACRPNRGERATPACLAQCLGISLPEVPLPDIYVPPLEEDQVLRQADVCVDGYQDFKRALMAGSDAWAGIRATHSGGIHALYTLADSVNPPSEAAPGSQICSWSNATASATRTCCALDDSNDLDILERVWGDLQCADAHGFQFAEAFTNSALGAVLDPAAEAMWRALWPAAQGGAASGILLHTALASFDAAAKHYGAGGGPEDAGGDSNRIAPPQLRLFSAHDTTVFALLAALGVTDAAPLPGYTAHVMMELWEWPEDLRTDTPKEERFSVKITYDDSPVLARRDDGGILEAGVCALADCKTALASRLVAECQLLDAPPPETQVCHALLDGDEDGADDVPTAAPGAEDEYGVDDVPTAAPGAGDEVGSDDVPTAAPGASLSGAAMPPTADVPAPEVDVAAPAPTAAAPDAAPQASNSAASPLDAPIGTVEPPPAMTAPVGSPNAAGSQAPTPSTL